MNILILGATGATGRLLTQQLLEQGHSVKVIVRSKTRLPEDIQKHQNLTVIEASVLDLTDAELRSYVEDCDAVASCLGHNISFKGIYGQPRKLVTDATRRICDAIKATRQGTKTKFVLMNTTGNRNLDLDEPISFAEKMIVGLLRVALPPHVDNEQAAEHLRTQIGQNDPVIGWVAVRPDGLIDETAVTPYDLHPSPIRSAIFDAGKTSRINVAHFMADLMTNEQMWQQWQGQMPVIYNREKAAVLAV